MGPARAVGVSDVALSMYVNVNVLNQDVTVWQNIDRFGLENFPADLTQQCPVRAILLSLRLHTYSSCIYQVSCSLDSPQWLASGAIIKRGEEMAGTQVTLSSTE